MEILKNEMPIDNLSYFSFFLYELVLASLSVCGVHFLLGLFLCYFPFWLCSQDSVNTFCSLVAPLYAHFVPVGSLQFFHFRSGVPILPLA
jgi:hypothetical protein